MRIRLILIGSGALSREIISLVNEINGLNEIFDILGFLDDGVVKGTEVRSLKVLGSTNDIGLFENVQYLIAIGNPKLRKELFEKVKAWGASLPNLIHPNARIDKYCKINWDHVEGNIICANAFLSCDVNIGNNNLINVGSILSHDTILGSHNAIMQGCILNGNVRFKDECFVKAGVTISGKFEFNNEYISCNI